jgi:hypothetical protein
MKIAPNNERKIIHKQIDYKHVGLTANLVLRKVGSKRFTILTLYKAQWLLYVPPGFYTQKFYIYPTVYLCVLISEQTAIISLYSIN